MVIGNNVTIINSVTIDSKIDDKSKVVLCIPETWQSSGKNVKIGDFVEIKNSAVGDDTKYHI